MAQRPNILWLLTDQHVPSISGFEGNSVIRTQHLDKLAARSVQFDAAICSSPVCTPSRMSMMTGREVHRCGAWNNHWVIFPEHPTWPGHFVQHGYRTCLVGKMHFGGKNQMNGFQHRPYGDLKHGLGHQPDPIENFPCHGGAGGACETTIPESLTQDVIVTRETLSFLLEQQDREPETPWFCCASYIRPHPPFTTPGRYMRYYRDKVPDISTPPDAYEKLDPFSKNLSNNESGQQLSDEQRMRGREGYYACIDFVDDCIGELLDGLEKAEAMDNTIIIYTSDHGEMAGEHGLWGKGIYFEESIRVPLLICGPGIEPGHHRVADPVSLMDLFPTMCSLAGLPQPDSPGGLDGVDASVVLRDPTQPGPRTYVPSGYYSWGVRAKGAFSPSEDEPHQAMRTLRSRDWKYVEIEKGDPLLFDLANDPHEMTNLATDPQHADRIKEMRDALHKGFSWDGVHRQFALDRERLPQFLSGLKPTTPNQYMLPDGRIFDAERELYDARWQALPPVPDGGGIIPQMFG